MRYLVVLLSVSFILFSGCKNAKLSGVSQDNAAGVELKPVDEKYALANQKGMSDSTVMSHRKGALPILEHRIKESKQDIETLVSKDLWQVEAVLRGSDITFGEHLHGAWIDFNNDHSYKYGHWLETTGTGKYSYDSDKQLLLLVDDDSRIKPQEFQANVQNEAMVLVGNLLYGDNNMQAKFNKKTALVDKPAPKPFE